MAAEPVSLATRRPAGARPEPSLSPPPRAGESYTRFVTMMKIILPLIAAVLVALVVVWPQFREVREGFRVEITKLKSSLGGQEVSNARYTGTDARGRPYTVIAKSAAQVEGQPDLIRLKDPKADMTMQGGAWVASSAETGNFRRSDQILDPHSRSGDVWVIDPATYRVVARYPVGKELQHVVPSWDLRTLYATDDRGDAMLPFDAHTGAAGARFPVIDPYNLYFTPDGAYAISVAERLRKLVWYDPKTWQVHDETSTPDCAGIDHADFSVDGRTAVFTCEFAGRVAVIDVPTHHVLRMIDMPHRDTRMGPQDIKLAPDGSVWYIADSDAGGLWVLDGAATHVLRFIPTGHGAHGLYLSRDARRLYVTNRHEGSISVIDSYTGDPITVWRIPGGGSPDMGNLTADGTQLWLSGRYNGVVYVLSTQDGSVLRKIPVGDEPHGLCVWPQPGRYSLGHTGITR